MAGMMSFKVTVYQTNVEVLPQLEAKARDLTPLFHEIIDEWARQNKEKFAMAEGHEASGAQVDPTVFWKALSPAYLKSKQKHFPTNTIMVRTGSLEAAMTDPEGFFRMVEPEQAVFGRPNDADDAMKVQYNWNTRQVVFLSDADQNMIREKTAKYFTIETRSIRQEAAQLDAAFEGTVGG